MQRVLDDLGRTVVITRTPRRIVSLVPSDTYSVVALGAGERLVGRTRYCVEPAGQLEGVAVVGGTKDVDVDAVRALAPDVVLANQEENTRSHLEALAAAGVPVLVSMPRRVEAGVAHLARLARLLGVERGAACQALMRAAYALRAPDDAPRVRVFAPIWLDPLMTANAETYLHAALAWIGADNVFGDRMRLYPLAADLGKGEAVAAGGRDERYPRVTLEEVAQRAPNVLLVLDEPWTFSDADVAALAAGCAGARVVRVSGKDLLWHGAWAVTGLGRARAALVGEGGR
jgi:ABC-type Fe3+-hydroxamate transport system substrate-binding protein